MTQRHLALAHLFRSTAQAHHRAFIGTNGDDPDWPAWYAQEMAAPLSALLGVTIEPENLARALRKLDQDIQRKAPSSDWTLYYADWFLSRQSAA